MTGSAEDIVERWWLVFEIGCVEHGIDSRPIGLFATQAEAEAARAAVLATETKWNCACDQYDCEVFELSSPRRRTASR